MLLQFNVSNHLSFKEDQQLSLVASSLKDVNTGLIRSESLKQLDVLPAVVIYGANASGKSNLVDALSFVRSVIMLSHSRGEASGGVPRTPFALDPQCRNEATTFDIEFVLNDVRYNYGFECDDEAFLSEWLFTFPHGHRRTLFERDHQSFKFGRSLSGRNTIISELTRPNSLFLSAAVQNAHEKLTEVASFFQKIQLDSSISVAGEMVNAKILPDMQVDDRVIEFLKRIGTGVTGYRRNKAQVPDEVKEVHLLVSQALKNLKNKSISWDDNNTLETEEIELAHIGRDGEEVYFKLDRESAGTRRLLILLGRVCRALDEGGILIVDELDASLHTQACEAVLAFFSDPIKNPHGAQLIATTHDTNLLASGLLRRDQIWFAEKGPDGASNLYPLTDIRTRSDDNLERGYLQGRFGAVPFAGAMLDTIVKGHK